MNDVIYEFESEMKYRRLKPKKYIAILIIGLLISVPRLLLSVVVILSYLLIRTEIVQSDIQFIAVYSLLFFFLLSSDLPVSWNRFLHHSNIYSAEYFPFFYSSGVRVLFPCKAKGCYFNLFRIASEIDQGNSPFSPVYWNISPLT